MSADKKEAQPLTEAETRKKFMTELLTVLTETKEGVKLTLAIDTCAVLTTIKDVETMLLEAARLAVMTVGYTQIIPCLVFALIQNPESEDQIVIRVCGLNIDRTPLDIGFVCPRKRGMDIIYDLALKTGPRFQLQPATPTPLNQSEAPPAPQG